MSKVQSDKELLTARFKSKCANGLTDAKFFVDYVKESTVDTFCKENNDIDRALELGDFTELNWKGQ